jgi:hypothetical protein
LMRMVSRERDAANGAASNGKISLTREELIELLSPAARASR